MKFYNFYKRFIFAFSLIVVELTELLKRSKKKKFTHEFVLTFEARTFFRKFKEAFTTASLLRHFNQLLKIMLEVDAFKFVIFDIISQLNEKTEE